MSAELIACSSFSLLQGASTPQELVETASSLGFSHLGLVDRDGVYGIVEAHNAAKDVGLHLVCGATLTVAQRPPVVLLAEDLRGWSNLCNLLTLARSGMDKGWARSSVQDIANRAQGLTCILRYGWTVDEAEPLRDAFGDRLEILVSRRLSPVDRERVRWAVALGRALERPLVASNDVLYHTAARRRLHDVVTCIRRRTRLVAAGRMLSHNGERHLLEPSVFRARYRDLPGTVHRASYIAERCGFTPSQLHYRYPREGVPDDHTPVSWLRERVEQGLRARYPGGVSSRVRAQIEHELCMIAELNFASYFLTVYDVVRFARDRGILCQGRGSAANSSVCYALGITEVDPSRSSLLFERFISAERGEPPDIDVDFEHERREEVIQYIYDHYGRDRAALVNEVIAYRARSAIRDVGKVFGLSLDQVERLASTHSRWNHGTLASREELVREVGLDPEDASIRHTLYFSAELEGFPRHIGIHVGGFVISEGPLTDLVPVEPAAMEHRTVIQWDKYAVEDVQFVKVDVLGLGILSCIRKAFDLIAHHGGEHYTMATVPPEDPLVYDMFCAADTVGVFQIESRAQMSMLPRLRPRQFYDLVIEVAIVRPGPIQGGMVHPYLLRRCGQEPVSYTHPLLEPILERTLGVPLFQEQVMAMAVAVGGFTPGEADELRRAMGAWRKRGKLDVLGRRLVQGMVERGIAPAYAEAIYSQIQGFGEYGFPESHAASFALLVYVSGWLKCHHPAVFAAALINSQPMGFYTPRAIIEDVRRHDVNVRPVCVQRSGWDCSLERDENGVLALRLGMRLVRSLGQSHAEQLIAAREERRFVDLTDLAWRSRLDRRCLQALADAGALRALVPNRREAAWILQGLWVDLPLFSGIARHEPAPDLPVPTNVDIMKADFRSVGLSLDHRPTTLARAQLQRCGIYTPLLKELKSLPTGKQVQLVGLISSRQRPQTASGVVFMTLEDESGLLNLVVWPHVWDRYRRLAVTASILGINGRLQRDRGAMAVIVERIWLVEETSEIWVKSRNFR